MLNFLWSVKDTDRFKQINSTLISQMSDKAKNDDDDDKVGNLATKETKAPKFDFAMYGMEG